MLKNVKKALFRVLCLGAFLSGYNKILNRRSVMLKNVKKALFRVLCLGALCLGGVNGRAKC
ncbi:hypothetical protein KVL97_05545 [Helicobacter pylori]|nr:hypothetical protein KVL97_05545 [Helicobacter pylori]